MANSEWHRIPVHEVPRGQLVAETQRLITEYRKRYAMSSAEMAALVDSDAIVPDIEVIKRYHAYHGLKFLLATSHTTGTARTTAKTLTASS